MRKNVALALGLMLSSIGAASAADVSECMTIKDEAVRLFCYARAAGRGPAAAPSETAPAAVATPPPPTVDAAPAPSPAPVPAPVAKPAVKEPKRIESRIAGAFSGWQAGTRFTLENGQTWEAVSLTRFSAKLDSPKVVIEKDLIGQNQLSVEGYKDRTVVRRIETE